MLLLRSEDNSNIKEGLRIGRTEVYYSRVVGVRQPRGWINPDQFPRTDEVYILSPRDFRPGQPKTGLGSA